MKTICTLSFLSILFHFNAQTNVISLKSHSGDLAEIHQESDNFGEIYIPPTNVDTVFFISNGVIVESKRQLNHLEGFEQKNQSYYDTIRSSFYTKTLTYSLKRHYSKNTVFIGFDEEKATEVNPYFNNMHKNSVPLILLIFGIFISFGNYFRKRINA